MIDSLEMTAEHRNYIADECEQCAEDKIVITHGTDTMAETSPFWQAELPTKPLY